MKIEDMQHLRGKTGIYALISNNKVVYIGSSGNMYIRLLEHTVSSKIQFDRSIGVVQYDVAPDDLEELRIVEMGMICDIKPSCNKIVFNNFREWVYSLPHRNYSNKEIFEFEDIIKKAVDHLAGKLS